MKFIIINGWERQTRQDRGNSTDDFTSRSTEVVETTGLESLGKVTAQL